MRSTLLILDIIYAENKKGRYIYTLQVKEKHDF